MRKRRPRGEGVPGGRRGAESTRTGPTLIHKMSRSHSYGGSPDGLKDGRVGGGIRHPTGSLASKSVPGHGPSGPKGGSLSTTIGAAVPLPTSVSTDTQWRLLRRRGPDTGRSLRVSRSVPRETWEVRADGSGVLFSAPRPRRPAGTGTARPGRRPAPVTSTTALVGPW